VRPPHLRLACRDDRDTPLASRRDNSKEAQFPEKRKRNILAATSSTGDPADTASEIGFSTPAIPASDGALIHHEIAQIAQADLPDRQSGRAVRIFQKLMAKPACAEVAMQFVNATAYVCQGQRILTAQYKRERDTRGRLMTRASADDIASSAKAAVQMQGHQSPADQQGRWFSGSALQDGFR
jgi:hypothetical protein